MLQRATTVFSRFVGPAALTAAGMIGAGAVATRLLAGAWFGFDLLWVALLVIPMVIFTLDSASRIGVTSGGRGLIDMIRTDIGAWLAWVVFLPMALVNVVVNMSQMSAMVEGAYGAMGMLPPPGGEATLGLFIVTIVLTGTTVVAAVLGGYKRMETIMTALLVVILVCFIFVADQGPARLADLAGAGRRPRADDSRERAGVRRARPRERMPSRRSWRSPGRRCRRPCCCPTATWPPIPATRPRMSKRTFWKTVTNLGVVWGLFSVVVIVAGATALHNVYTGSGPTHLGVSHYSQIETHPRRGPGPGSGVSGRARFPGAALLLDGPDRRRLHDADFGVADDDVFLSRHRAPELALHRRQHRRSRPCSRRGSPCPRWWRRSGSCRRC